MTRKVGSLVVQIGAGLGWRIRNGEIALGCLLVGWGAGWVLDELRNVKSALDRAAQKLRESKRWPE